MVHPLPQISVNDASLAEGNSGTSYARFTISLSEASDQAVTVDYSFADSTVNSATNGIDYGAGSGTIPFAPGQTTRFLDVPVFGDTQIEPNEHFFLQLSNPTNAAIAHDTGHGIILNDDSDISRPSAKLKSAPLLLTGRASKFSVIYSDNISLNASTIGAGDVLVTGPHRYRQVVKFVAKSPSSNSAGIMAVYQMPAPGGRWNSADNGTYTVWVQAGAVSDTSGNALLLKNLGSYRVRLTNRTRRIRTQQSLNLVSASPAPTTSLFESLRRIHDHWLGGSFAIGVFAPA